jgi:hypothetical protein
MPVAVKVISIGIMMWMDQMPQPSRLILGGASLQILVKAGIRAMGILTVTVIQMVPMRGSLREISVEVLSTVHVQPVQLKSGAVINRIKKYYC